MSSYSSPTLKNLTLSHKAGKKESKSMSNLKIIITGLSPAMNQVGEICSHTDDGVSLSVLHGRTSVCPYLLMLCSRSKAF